jgi:hypothetical protein
MPRRRDFKQFSCRVRPSLLVRLQRLATREGNLVSSVTRRLLEKAVTAEEAATAARPDANA